MKYLLIIVIAITINISLSANSEHKITLPQEIALSQTAQLRISLGLSDKQALLTYNVILNAAKEINDYENKNETDLKTKMMEVQANSTEKFKNILSKNQFVKYIEIITNANSKNSSIFYRI